jgi:hypothetical protein
VMPGPRPNPVRRVALVLVIALAWVIAGCGPTPAAGPTAPAHAPATTRAPGLGSVLPAVPIPVATARKLPPGVFYLQGGPKSGEPWTSSVWEVTAGREVLITRGNLGRQIAGFAASQRGMFVSANVGMFGDVGWWTRAGPSWLHPLGQPDQEINGVAPDISPDGTVAYLNGSTGVWVKSPQLNHQQFIYRVSFNDGIVQPAFGPDQLLAMIGPFWQNNHHRPDVVILGDDGTGGVVATLHTGFAQLGYVAFWGPSAPALVVGSSKGANELLFLSGRRQLLPAHWRPLAWNPAGRDLLMVNSTTLGIWSLARPRQVTIVGSISRGYQIPDAEWLNKPAANT